METFSYIYKFGKIHVLNITNRTKKSHKKGLRKIIKPIQRRKTKKQMVSWELYKTLSEDEKQSLVE